jgi:hypothetical protein
MGWGSSGTRIFDAFVEKILLNSALTDRDKEDWIRSVVDVLREEDWDAEGETKFYDDPIVRKVLGFTDE